MRTNAKNVRGTMLVWAGFGTMLAACAPSPGFDSSVFGAACEGDEGCDVEPTDPDTQPEDRTPEAETDGSSGGDDDGGGDHDRCSESKDRCDSGDSGGSDGGGAGDDGSGPSEPEPTCCEVEEQICLDGGESSSVCSSIRELCHHDACEQLVDVCDPTTVPVSHGCARAYYACFGFRINKCRRESYDSCFNALGDIVLCEAWEASCAEREAYCSELVSSDPLLEGGMEYYCTDWGHDFDPCWDQYLACTDDANTCQDELSSCASAGKLYDAWSCAQNGTDENEPDIPG